MQLKLPEKLNRKIGRAMHDYKMLADGDRVLVAVSGGVDSLVLTAVLSLWLSKAPIHYELLPVHIDHGFGLWPPEQTITPQLQRFDLPLHVVRERKMSVERSCFLCARNRRSQLFDFAKEKKINKIAFGHHRDDLLETFMLNAMYSGNLSTMRPAQEIFAGELTLIRPLAYLNKSDIVDLARAWGMVPVINNCPFEGNTRREKVHNFLEDFYQNEPKARDSLFAALANVRSDYLLK